MTDELRSPVVNDWKQASWPMDPDAGTAPNLGDFRPLEPHIAVGGMAPTRVDPSKLDFIPADTPVYEKPQKKIVSARRVLVHVGDKDYVPASETAERDRMAREEATRAAAKIMESFAEDIRKYHAAKDWLDKLTEEQREDPNLRQHIDRGYAILAKGLPMTEAQAYDMAYDAVRGQQHGG